MAVHPFAISHDAEDPAGFTIGQNGTAIGIATDLGIATSMVRQHLKRCSLIILEANHDPTMLETGPYPWPLKQRIRSRNGHLSNTAAGQLLARIAHPKLRQIVLGHLSETNNSPRIARQTVRQALNPYAIPVHIACQDRSSPVFHLQSRRY